MLDTKHLARILYENRTSEDYRSNEGKRRILAENGVKLAKRTFEGNAKEINKEISILHDKATDKDAEIEAEANLEKLFTKIDYINGLKRIWDEGSNKDKLQAGRQVAEFFGWNAATKSDINLKADVHELIKTGNLMLDSGKEPEGKEPKPLK